MSCDTCFIGHLGRRIWWWHSFLNFNRRKGQLQVKIGQKGWNFKFQNFLQKHAYLMQICLRIPKNHVFYVRQLEMPKIAFQKCDGITFTCFSAIAQPKTKILLWNFVCLLFVRISITYNPFFLINWGALFGLARPYVGLKVPCATLRGPAFGRRRGPS